jgi:cobalt-zinc-cadmium efflux system protein
MLFGLVEGGHLFVCPHRAGLKRKSCNCKPITYAFAFALAFIIAALEFWGSGASGSLALLSDAWHVVSDMLIYGISGYAFFAKRARPHEREELDAQWGFVNSWILTTVAVLISAWAIYRLFVPSEIKSGIMLSIAALGFAGNLLVLLVLCALHTDRLHAEAGRRDETHHTAILHTMTDAGLSLIVIAAAILMEIWPEVLYTRHADSAGSVIICLALLQLSRETRHRIRRTKKA